MSVVVEQVRLCRHVVDWHQNFSCPLYMVQGTPTTIVLFSRDFGRGYLRVCPSTDRSSFAIIIIQKSKGPGSSRPIDDDDVMSGTKKQGFRRRIEESGRGVRRRPGYNSSLSIPIARFLVLYPPSLYPQYNDSTEK
eukprot:scaffold31_cov171-Amphora_coffeaeformis.AAC.3